jgi:secreted Zn-dependent insulinase-like peptidase
MCIVQSNFKAPEFIWGRIKEFFDQSEIFINSLDDELFKTHVNSVIVINKKKSLSLSDEVIRNSLEVKKRRFQFDGKEKEIEILEKLQKEDLINFYIHHFVDNIRRFDIEYISIKHSEDNKKYEEDNNLTYAKIGVKRIKTSSVHDFKRRNSLNPDFYHI